LAEWLVEEGIGEHRAALLDGGDIVAARIDWPGGLAAGLVEDAILTSRTAGSTRGTARFPSGEEALVDGLPRQVSEGSRLRLAVTRAALREGVRIKLAQARPTDEPVRPAPSLAQQLGARIVPQLDAWDELWTEAVHGSVPFAGGSLTFEPTAAMTAVDVDGTLPPKNLALAAIPALVRSIRRFDLAGSVVIDFPSLAAKADRKAVDAALAEALVGLPNERTAMNGFGLVQLVIRRERPSVLELLDRWPDAAVRILLRHAERVGEPGVLLLTAPTLVQEACTDGWLAELERRTGRQVRWAVDDRLAPWGGFAQAVPA
jgi:ribonuclease G